MAAGSFGAKKDTFMGWQSVLPSLALLSVIVAHSCASRLEARQSGGHGWNAVAQSEFPIFRRETHRCPIERGRPPATFCIYYLSFLNVRAPSARQGSRHSYY